MGKAWAVEYCVQDETTTVAQFATQEAAEALWQRLPADGGNYEVTQRTCDVVEYPLLDGWDGPPPDREALYRYWPDHRAGRIVTPREPSRE